MPWAAKRHGAEQKQERARIYERERGTAAERGYDSRWRAYRLSFLRHNPLCVKCKAAGRIVAATVVDHIEPHRGDKVKFWDKKNHQAMCEECHNSKTATEDGGFGNAGKH